jgi:hypothetical protein
MHSVWLALFVTWIIEVPIVAALFPGQRLRMGLVALVANAVTNLAMNVVLGRLPLLGPHWVVVGEAIALVVEAAAYAALSRPRQVARALLASGLGNAASFAGGGLIASVVRAVAG